jgi:hypothetical protein
MSQLDTDIEISVVQNQYNGKSIEGYVTYSLIALPAIFRVGTRLRACPIAQLLRWRGFKRATNIAWPFSTQSRAQTSESIDNWVRVILSAPCSTLSKLYRNALWLGPNRGDYIC